MKKGLAQILGLCYYNDIKKCVFCRKNRRRDKSMVNSVEFAAYLHKRATDEGYQPNVTQIQKWLYICYGHHLVINKKPLFDEKPRAWPYGPVFLNVYNAQKSDAGLPNANDSMFLELEEIVSATLENHGKWSATKLVDWTHEKNGAWDKQWHKEKLAFMTDGDIRADFERLFDYEQN